MSSLRRPLLLAALPWIALLTLACVAPAGQDSVTPSPVGTPAAPPPLTSIATALPSPSPTPSPVPPTVTPQPEPAFAPPDPVAGVGEVAEARVADQVFQLEVARTPEERARGLMDRPNLPMDAAMLFVYEEEAPRTFWMKNTLISLDILFLDAAGVVVDVQTMHPQPGATDATLRRYPSAQPARYAMEMNAGLAEQYGVTPGEQVLFR